MDLQPLSTGNLPVPRGEPTAPGCSERARRGHTSRAASPPETPTDQRRLSRKPASPTSLSFLEITLSQRTPKDCAQELDKFSLRAQESDSLFYVRRLWPNKSAQVPVLGLCGSHLPTAEGWPLKNGRKTRLRGGVSALTLQ